MDCLNFYIDASPHRCTALEWTQHCRSSYRARITAVMAGRARSILPIIIGNHDGRWNLLDFFGIYWNLLEFIGYQWYCCSWAVAVTCIFVYFLVRVTQQLKTSHVLLERRAASGIPAVLSPVASQPHSEGRLCQQTPEEFSPHHVLALVVCSIFKGHFRYLNWRYYI